MCDYLVRRELDLDKERVKESGFTNLSPTAVKIFENSKLRYLKDVVSRDGNKSRTAVGRLVDRIFSG